MKYLYLTLVYITSLITCSFGQTLSGTINDNENKPVPYSTVYVKDLKFGTVSNEQGQYKLKLKAGEYTILFQCLGFETIEKKVSIKDGDNLLNIILNVKTYQLTGVRVKPNAEDPAYSIIRKAIGMAPYYQNQVKQYDAEVYMKGSMKVIKLSWLVKRALRNEENVPKEGSFYLQESLNNVHFTAPDKYVQTVKMIRSNFPTGDSNNDDAIEFSNTSLYQPKIGEIILPLSPYALNHYKYRYEGYSKEGDRIINKIKVIPRRKSKQLVEGYLYIADNYWNIHSADFTVETLLGKYQIQQTFGEVEKNVWLPINHNFELIGKLMGSEGNVRFVSSVKYKSVVLNTDIRTPNNLVDKTTQEKVAEKSKQANQAKVTTPSKAIKEQKRKEKIEKLLEKDDLSNRDMYQLAKLMEKDAKESDTAKMSLEIIENHKVKVDSLARKVDTTQWSQIRPIALTADEVIGMEDLRKSVVRKDSISNKKDTIQKGKSIFMAIITGNNWRNKDKKREIAYSGIFNVSHFRFNTVDGFVAGMGLKYNKTFKDRDLYFNPQIAYAFNRKAVMGGFNGWLSYTPLRRGHFGITAGSESVDFNQEVGVNRFGNTVASLAFRTNYMKLYEHHYGEVYNRIDLANGFEFLAKAGYYDRRMLKNITDFSFYPNDKNSYTPNYPVNDSIFGKYTPDHQAFITKISFSYTPDYYYRMYEGRKYMISSKYPTFLLDTRFEIPDIAGSDVKFVHLEIGVKQSIKTGSSNRITYKLLYGDFLMKDRIYFPDFKHFNTQEIPVNIVKDSFFGDTYQLLEYYKHSTSSWYTQGFLYYSSPFLAIKYLPWFSNRMWFENLYISSLSTKASKPYWEFGYSITQISLLGGIGVFVGFEGQKYMGFGVKASFKLSGEISM